MGLCHAALAKHTKWVNIRCSLFSCSSSMLSAALSFVAVLLAASLLFLEAPTFLHCDTGCKIFFEALQPIYFFCSIWAPSANAALPPHFAYKYPTLLFSTWLTLFCTSSTLLALVFLLRLLPLHPPLTCCRVL